MLIARDYFEQAVNEIPDLAVAHGWLAWTWFFDVYMGWVEDPGPSLQKTFDEAREAVRLDPSLDFAHWALGAAHMAAGDNASSLTSFEEALRLNPNNSDALANKAWPLTFVDRAGEAVESVESAIRLNPYYPEWYLWGMGIAEYSRDRFQPAAQALERMSQPNEQSLAYLASAALRSENPDAASNAIDRLLHLEPGFRIERLVQALPYDDSRVPDRLAEDLSGLGLG
jgi:tetratricopeptide (TPR) repeat protein